MTSQKTKPALALWVIRHRKALGMKPPDVAKAVGAAAETVRGWESGRGIGPDFLHALENLFGEDAPNGDAGSVPNDLADAITALVAALDADREERLALTRAIAALAQSLATTPEVGELLRQLALRGTAG